MQRVAEKSAAAVKRVPIKSFGAETEESEHSNASAPPRVLVATEVQAIQPTQLQDLTQEGWIAVLLPKWLLCELMQEHLTIPPALDQSETEVSIDDLRIDLSDRKAWWRDQPLSLTEQEISILSVLVSARGRAVSFSRLSNAVWDSSYAGCEEAMRAAIKRLRRKIIAAKVPALLESVRGFGFRVSLASENGKMGISSRHSQIPD